MHVQAIFLALNIAHLNSIERLAATDAFFLDDKDCMQFFKKIYIFVLSMGRSANGFTCGKCIHQYSRHKQSAVCTTMWKIAYFKRNLTERSQNCQQQNEIDAYGAT